MPPDPPTLTIARLIRLFEKEAGDLTLAQYRVLGQLSAGDERASMLASRLAVAKPTMTAIVDSLVTRGFVTREVVESDRRAVRISITPAGRRAAEDTGAALRGVLDSILDRCDRPDAVLAALADISSALDARWTERAAAGVSDGAADGGDGAGPGAT